MRARNGAAGVIDMKRILVTGIVVAASLAAGIVAAGDARALAAGRTLAAGDSLVYDLTLEVQMHANGAKPGASMTSDASGSGTETLAIDHVDPDGTAHAAVTVSFRGTSDGRPVSVDQAWRVRLAPDGEIRSDGVRPSLGPDLDQALAFINGLARGLASRTLTSGAGWKTMEPIGSVPGNMTITSKVTGVQPYQGFRTYVIEQRGVGVFTQSFEGASGIGNIATGGTLYYDAANKLLIGGAARGQTEVAVKNANIDHISATTTVDVQLRAWNRASAQTAATAIPVASPESPVDATSSASPAVDSSAPANASPAPAPSPAYTPAPSAPPTAGPVSTGF
jgi:hypothetical protein